jgi:DNA-binding NarL/FixJ family response regulator
MTAAALPITTLPPRQRQVLECLGRGLRAKETADELGMALNTVKHTRALIYRKLDASNAAEAVRRACRAGLL